MNMTVMPLIFGVLGTVTKGKGPGGTGNKMISGYHPDYCIIKIT